MHTLLLADESVTVQRVIALTFAEQEIRVVAVPDGQQAMAKMSVSRPDIVLAGTTLPQVSGYDLVKFMRGTKDLKDVPVLLLSGAFETVDDARLKSSGANGILEKPVEPTVVIGRVKELLGLKSDEKAAPGARTITPASVTADKSTGGKRLPASVPPRAVTSTKGTPSKWEQLRNQTGLDHDTKSVEDSSAGRGDYLDTLDSAFDTLDRQIAGRPPAVKTPRNPAGPLGQAASAAPGNPVYEVDDGWFDEKDNKARAEAKEGQREINEDLHDPALMPARKKPDAASVYEVDDEWFKEDDRKRAAKAEEQAQLAAEMGIHDVAFEDAPAKKAEAADFEFGVDDLKKIEPMADAPKVEAPKPVEKPAALAPTPVAIAPMPPPVAPHAHQGARSAPKLADDFDALLAFERGERSTPPLPEIKVVTPEITEGMLDQIAARVADRLTASAFGEQLRNAMTATMREAVDQTVSATVSASVQPIVAETSERVVREVVSETSERVVREVVAKTVENVVRDVVSQTAERAVREVVEQTTERVVREVVAQSTERVVREIVPEVAERTVREAVTQATERLIPEAVSQATERVVREVVPGTAERIVRDVVFQTTERAVPEAVAQATERVVREVVPHATERVVREVVSETSDRAVREVISATSERLVRDEIERIKSKRQ